MGALASAWGAEVITKIFSVEKLKRRLSCLKKKKRICRNIRLGNQDSMQTQNWLDHSGRSILQQRIPPPQSPFLLLTKCQYTWNTGKTEYSPLEIYNLRHQKPCLAVEPSLSVSLFLYLSFCW